MISGRSSIFSMMRMASAESRIADVIFGSQLAYPSASSGLYKTDCLCLTTLSATWSISQKRGVLPVWLTYLLPGGPAIAAVTTGSWTGTCQFVLLSFSEWLISCRELSGNRVNTLLELRDATMRHTAGCPIHGESQSRRSSRRTSTSDTTRPSDGTVNSQRVSSREPVRSFHFTLDFHGRSPTVR